MRTSIKSAVKRSIFAYYNPRWGVCSSYLPAARKQNPENPILHICGLGASVGCESEGEHSTRRDENHKYGGWDSLDSSPFFVANQNKSQFSLHCDRYSYKI